MAIADFSRLQFIDGGDDGNLEIIRLLRARADAAPVEEEAGPLEVERAEQARGYQIGHGLGDAEFGLGEHGAIPAGVFQHQRARRAIRGRGGAVVGGGPRGYPGGGQRQLNNDTASELSRRPFPHWAGRPPPAEGCRGPACPAPSPARWARPDIRRRFPRWWRR